MEDDKLIEMLVDLEKIEAFRAWRDQVVKEYIARLEQELQVTDQMPEAILRYKLKTYQTIKDLFINIFEQAKEQKRQEKYARDEEIRTANKSA
jgi:predicted ATP-dependent Lon-type protease